MWCTVSYISTYTSLSFLSSILLACHLRKNLPLLTNAFKLATTLVISKFRLGLLKSSHIEIVNSLNQIIRQKIYCAICVSGKPITILHPSLQNVKSWCGCPGCFLQCVIPGQDHTIHNRDLRIFHCHGGYGIVLHQICGVYLL